jgi:hypothetical protein
MRNIAQVFLTYGLVLVVAALWRLLPLGRAVPDIVALSAIYLGLTARARLWPSVLGAVVAGYLADLLLGGPRGLLATAAGILCIVGHLVQGRLIVRGRLFTLVFSLLVGLASVALLLTLRGASGMTIGGLGDEAAGLLVSILLTGLCGPIFFSLARRVDARFARTQRERDAALEGFL